MKKFFALALTLVMALTLAACGGGGEEKAPGAEEQTPVEESKLD